MNLVNDVVEARDCKSVLLEAPSEAQNQFTTLEAALEAFMASLTPWSSWDRARRSCDFKHSVTADAVAEPEATSSSNTTMGSSANRLCSSTLRGV